jgi:hypothetical protein
MNHKKTIKQRVLEDVFDIWDNKGVEYARDELKKMYLREYNMLTDIEDKRLILHNLAVAEMNSKIKSMESVKLYTKTLKEDMDKIPNYKEENGCLYARVLANYSESHKNELSKKELIEIYEFCYQVYERCDDPKDNGYLSKIVAKFNLNLVKKNFNMILDIIKEMLIHNENSQYEEILQQFTTNVKEEDISVYQQILLMEQNYRTKIS